MTVTFDNTSDSFHQLIALITACSWLEEEERQKLELLAPFMTPFQRSQISKSLNTEAEERLLGR